MIKLRFFLVVSACLLSSATAFARSGLYAGSVNSQDTSTSDPPTQDNQQNQQQNKSAPTLKTLRAEDLPVVRLANNVQKSQFVPASPSSFGERKTPSSYVSPSADITEDVRKVLLAHPQRISAIAETTNMFLQSDLVYVKPETITNETVARTFMSFLDPSYAFLSEKDVSLLASDPLLQKAIDGSSFEWGRKVVSTVTSKILVASSLKSCTASFSENDQKFTPPAKWQMIAPTQKYVMWQCLQNQSDKNYSQKAAESFTKVSLLGLSAKMNGMTDERIAEVFIKAHTYAVDPHSIYLTASEKRAFKYQLNKTFSGFGVSWKIDEAERVFFVTPPDFLEQQKFIPENAELITILIDGKQVLFKGKKDAEIRSLFDKAGSTAQIVYQVNGVSQTVQVPKRKISLKNSIVSSKKIRYQDQDVLMVKIPLFYQDENSGKTDRVGGSVSSDLARVLKDINPENTDLIVLDLRGNGGGLLNEAVKALSLFIDGGVAVQLRSAKNKETGVIDIPKGEVLWKGPLVVLVDRSSASASEIFASSIQDNARGLIVGQKTFGKGTVQNTFDLDSLAGTEDTFGQINLTTMVFFRPSGLPLQFNGVVPDIQFRDPSTSTGEASMANAIVNKQKVDDKSQRHRKWGRKINKTKVTIEKEISLMPWYTVWSQKNPTTAATEIVLNEGFFQETKKSQADKTKIIGEINSDSKEFKNDPMAEYAVRSGFLFYREN